MLMEDNHFYNFNQLLHSYIENILERNSVTETNLKNKQGQNKLFKKKKLNKYLEKLVIYNFKIFLLFLFM